MILVLCYKRGDIIVPFSSKMHLDEYYITNNYSEFKVFVKGNDLDITASEYELLSSEDFEVCLANGVVLFNKSELQLCDNKIMF